MRRPGSHPEAPGRIDVVETHFAWVFLGERVVRKLKKPLRTSRVDFSTLALREAACHAELNVNRPLAPDVYLGLDRLTRRADGSLALNGDGSLVEPLVRMKRLPAARTLDRAKIRGGGELSHVADRLADFYRSDGGTVWAGGWSKEVTATLDRLAEDVASGPLYSGAWLVADARRFAQREATALQARASSGRVVDGHGDLRPEHVYLTSPPRILDRIEFNPALRRSDWLADVALLAVELEQLRRDWVGTWLAHAISERLDDRLPSGFFDFYRVWRAALRAQLCIEHRLRPGRRTESYWTRRAWDYLRIAERHVGRLNRLGPC